MADDVKSLLLEIDASVELLRRNIKRGEDYVDGFAKNVDRRLDGVDRRFDQTGRGVTGIGRTMDGVKGKVDAFGASLKAAAVGFIAAQGVDAALRLVKSGLDYAGALGEQAEQMGVTTKALQEYRYVALQTGITQEELDGALVKGTKALGEAAAGAKGPADAFKKLGVDIRDAEGNVRNFADLIPEISDGLNKLPTVAERTAVGNDILGKSFSKLNPLFNLGSKGINEYRDAAQRLGIVLSDKQIQDADKAAGKLDDVKKVLQAKIAGTVADNANAIVELADAIAKLTGNAIKALAVLPRLYKAASNPTGFLDSITGIDSATGKPIRTADAAAGRAVTAQANKAGATARGEVFGPQRRRGGFRANTNFAGTGLNAILGTQSIADFAPGSGTGLPDLRTFGALVETFSKPTKEAAAKVNAFSIELDRMNADLALARASVTGSLTDRADAEKARIAADLAADRLRIQADKELTDAQKQKSIAVQEQIAAARVELVEQELAKDIAEQKREADQALLDQKLEALDDERRTLEVEADASVSRRERVEIERRILALQQEEERARLEAAIAAGQIADAAQARANLEQRQATERGQLEKAGLGPAGQYLEQLRLQAANLNDELENVAVSGLQSLNDGLANAIASGDSLGKVFDRVLDQILAGLIQIGLQQATLSIFGGGGGGLGSSLGGGLGGLSALGGLGGGATGGGGFFGSLFGSIGKLFGKRALGGPVSKGRTYLVGEQGQELFVPNVDGQIVSNSKLRNMSGGGGGGISLTINAPGATAETVAMIRRELANAAPQIVAAARNATAAEFSRQRLP